MAGLVPAIHRPWTRGTSPRVTARGVRTGCSFWHARLARSGFRSTALPAAPERPDAGISSNAEILGRRRGRFSTDAATGGAVAGVSSVRSQPQGRRRESPFRRDSEIRLQPGQFRTSFDACAPRTTLTAAFCAHRERASTRRHGTDLAAGSTTRRWGRPWQHGSALALFSRRGTVESGSASWPPSPV
jgi:hypothetical protein